LCSSWAVFLPAAEAEALTDTGVAIMLCTSGRGLMAEPLSELGLGLGCSKKKVLSSTAPSLPLPRVSACDVSTLHPCRRRLLRILNSSISPLLECIVKCRPSLSAAKEARSGSTTRPSILSCAASSTSSKVVEEPLFAHFKSSILDPNESISFSFEYSCQVRLCRILKPGSFRRRSLFGRRRTTSGSETVSGRARFDVLLM